MAIDAAWLSALAALAMASLTMGGVIYSHGRNVNRISNVETELGKLGTRVLKVEELSGTVQSLAQSVKHMGDLMEASQELAHSEMKALSAAMVAGNKLLDTQLAGFREMTDRELDEIKENVRAIRTSMDEQRSWEPPAERRRSTPPQRSRAKAA